MNYENLTNARGHVVDRFVCIELMINSIVSKHYLGKVETNFVVNVLNNEMASFGFKKTVLKQIIDEKTRKELTQKDWKELAKAYGQNLAEMHSLIYEYPGKYTDNYEGIKPFSPSYSSWIIDSINHLLEKSLSHNNKTTKEDANWVQKIIRRLFQ